MKTYTIIENDGTVYQRGPDGTVFETDEYLPLKDRPGWGSEDMLVVHNGEIFEHRQKAFDGSTLLPLEPWQVDLALTLPGVVKVFASLRDAADNYCNAAKYELYALIPGHPAEEAILSSINDL